MSSDRALVEAVLVALAARADPQRAAGAQAYLKSAMPMYGVRLPEVRAVVHDAGAARPPPDRPTWEATVRDLFDHARYREERYAALALAGHRLARPWQDPAALGLYQHLVRSGAWWDLVDETAHLVGRVLRGHHETVAPVVREWAVADDLWIRRSAVISQVGAKDAVDLDLLADCLVPNLERPEFWLRKACGWALRDVAPQHPDWVRAFVARHEQAMSGLTRREATRRLPTPGGQAVRTVE